MRQLKIATQITNRDSQAVEKYLQEISKIGMITPEEETILAQKIKMGDQRALERLTTANLRFVVSVAKQYQHSEVVCPYPLSAFFAVGVWYRSFDQVGDAEVIRLLGENRLSLAGTHGPAAARI